MRGSFKHNDRVLMIKGNRVALYGTVIRAVDFPKRMYSVAIGNDVLLCEDKFMTFAG